MEKIQQKATKTISELRNLSCKRRLQRLELVSLTQRRPRGQLIETFKYLNGLNNIHYRGSIFHHPVNDSYSVKSPYAQSDE
ncbi:hypothetical protein FHG87_008431 [Trinorchestia longiramus]|nr:hypothetical protein FHG87_008431 [Trinorchestia longiramus]